MKTLLSLSLLLAAAPAFSQLYSNGPMATGSTSSQGVVAPAGTQWSELQTSSTTPPNSVLGYSVNYLATGTTAPYRQGDDFTVPVGASWSVSSLTVYGFVSTSGAPVSFTSGVARIWNARPDAPGAAVVAGDLTTNRLVAQSFTGLYRVGRSAALQNSSRPIVAATLSLDATLRPGTYWMEYGLNAGTSNVFAPLVTIPGQTTVPNANGFFYTSQTYYAMTDTNSGVALAVPFGINGVQATPEPACLAALALGTLATLRRRKGR